MDWNDNIYYYPEKHGLSIFAELDTGGSYEFDKFVVWKDDERGRLYWDTDSGCSCPTPFEDVPSRDALNPIGSFSAFFDQLFAWTAEQYTAVPDAVQLAARVKQYLDDA
jgi:hypothetical protein